MRYILVLLFLFILVTQSFAGSNDFKIDDYRLNVVLSRRYDGLHITGRIAGKPKTPGMRIDVTVKSREGQVATIIGYAKSVNGRGGSPFRGNLRVYVDHKKWEIIDVELFPMQKVRKFH